MNKYISTIFPFTSTLFPESTPGKLGKTVWATFSKASAKVNMENLLFRMINAFGSGSNFIQI